MDAEEPPSDPAELLATHAGFLRRLARRLVKDEHLAEDAVQDVCARWLERPPRDRRRSISWLRTVLSNVTRNLSRAERHRRDREVEVARSGDARSASDVVAHEGLLRHVSEAVLALEEPLRRVVLMRYFQDLPSKEIASRLHLPLPTVRSRLRRAHHLLRLRLEREAGPKDRTWARGLAILTGLRRGGPLEPGLGSVGIALAGLGIATLLGLAALQAGRRGGHGDEASPAFPVLLSASDPSARTPAREELGRSELGGRREALAAPELSIELPRGLHVEGRVVGDLGQPIAGAEVR